MVVEVTTTNISLVASNKIICMIYAMPQQFDVDQTNIFYFQYLELGLETSVISHRQECDKLNKLHNLHILIKGTSI
jgi:hypothetical protein